MTGPIPQADNATRTLTFACRMCDFVEVDDKRTPIYRNDLLTVTREQAGVTTDLANDITLVSALLLPPFLHAIMFGEICQSHNTTLRCPKCGHNE
jgi:DNA-directed RNA polymerase II subunit RPB9